MKSAILLTMLALVLAMTAMPATADAPPCDAPPGAPLEEVVYGTYCPVKGISNSARYFAGNVTEDVLNNGTIDLDNFFHDYQELKDRIQACRNGGWNETCPAVALYLER